LHPDIELPMAIVPTILDVLDLFCGCKNVRLGVNRNPGHRSRWGNEKFSNNSSVSKNDTI